MRCMMLQRLGRQRPLGSSRSSRRISVSRLAGNAATPGLAHLPEAARRATSRKAENEAMPSNRSLPRPCAMDPAPSCAPFRRGNGRRARTASRQRRPPEWEPQLLGAGLRESVAAVPGAGRQGLRHVQRRRRRRRAGISGCAGNAPPPAPVREGSGSGIPAPDPSRARRGSSPSPAACLNARCRLHAPHAAGRPGQGAPPPAPPEVRR